MRRILITLIPLAACAEAQIPLIQPFDLAGQAAAHTARRGEVEVFVKTNHTAILTDINAGGGPTLTQAMDIAGVPLQDRPARLIQLRADQSLYQTAPGTLVTALMLYAG